MRPPAPAATLALGSPNPCNLCHADKDAAWADGFVRKWRRRDYQAGVLRRAELVEAARRHDWRRLPEMLAEIARGEEVPAASLARLLRDCPDPKKVAALAAAVRDRRPLVRAAAAEGLDNVAAPAGLAAIDPPYKSAIAALAAACGDDCRLVRLRAAAVLSGTPQVLIPSADRRQVERAEGQYLASLEMRPDLWSSHYNLGNYYLAKGDARAAAVAFETAIDLEPDVLLPYVNIATAYARLGRTAAADRALNKALEIDPGNPVASANLGMSLAEQSRFAEAEAAFRAALRRDPRSAVAAYNLSVLLADDRAEEAIRWAAVAYRSAATAKNGYNLAFLLGRNGKADEAIATLRAVVAAEPAFLDGFLLLGSLLEGQGRAGEAVRAYRAALRMGGLNPAVRRELERKIQSLRP
jgi:tetratricopeptide (TPR) repeat protein